MLFRRDDVHLRRRTDALIVVGRAVERVADVGDRLDGREVAARCEKRSNFAGVIRLDAENSRRSLQVVFVRQQTGRALVSCDADVLEYKCADEEVVLARKRVKRRRRGRQLEQVR